MLEEVVVGWWEGEYDRWSKSSSSNVFNVWSFGCANTWLVVRSGVVMQKNWALSVDQQWLQELQFLVHLINLLSILHRCNGFTGIQKAAVDQIGRRLPNSDHDHFWVQVQHWGVLWSFFAFQPHWTGHLQLSCTTHFSLHITSWSRNGSQLLSRIEDDISKHDFFFFPFSSWGTYEVFTFPVCFKCWMTLKWSTLSSSATSHIAVKGLALMIPLNWLLSSFDGWPLQSSSSRLYFHCKTSWTNIQSLSAIWYVC